MTQRIKTDLAPAAIGPYAQAVKADGWLFLSGQLPADPMSGDLISGDIGAQTHQIMRNIQAILDAAGGRMSDIVKTTVFLTDINQFAAMNAVYAGYFPDHPPARSTVQVARLPKDAQIEIEAVAVLKPEAQP